MKPLRRIGYLILCVPLLLSLPSRARGEYCAFEVAVKSPAGVPTKGVGVSAMSEGRSFSETQTDDSGIAKVCDAPATLVDISVGGHLCGAVTVRYLERLWMRTTRVQVTYEPCNGHEWFMPGGCMFTIRARDKLGKPIAGAEFLDSDDRMKKYEQTMVSDSYGRIFRFVNSHEKLIGEIRKDGYTTREVRESCEPDGNTNRDLTVPLDTAKQ